MGCISIDKTTIALSCYTNSFVPNIMVILFRLLVFSLVFCTLNEQFDVTVGNTNRMTAVKPSSESATGEYNCHCAVACDETIVN